MAKMHSRKKGRSGSKKPTERSPKPWISYSSEEIKQLVLKFAKAGKTPSQIGIILKDSYGIPDVRDITKKAILPILKENNVQSQMPEDMTALVKKEIRLMKHIENNKQDKSSKRGLLLTESKIKRLTKYYKRKGVLPADWKYNREQAKMVV